MAFMVALSPKKMPASRKYGKRHENGSNEEQAGEWSLREHVNSVVEERERECGNEKRNHPCTPAVDQESKIARPEENPHRLQPLGKQEEPQALHARTEQESNERSRPRRVHEIRITPLHTRYPVLLRGDPVCQHVAVHVEIKVLLERLPGMRRENPQVPQDSRNDNHDTQKTGTEENGALSLLCHKSIVPSFSLLCMLPIGTTIKREMSQFAPRTKNLLQELEGILIQ